MKQFLLGLILIIVGLFCFTCVDDSLTVQEVIENTECDYIVKDENSWCILEPSEYLREPVTEIAICDDTENTLCFFIYLDENEEKIIRKGIDN